MKKSKETRAIERRIEVKKDGLLAGYQLIAKIQKSLDALELERRALSKGGE